MKKTLLSYEEAKKIVENNETFYEKVCLVNGVKVSIFNYRLSQYSDFEQPFESSDIAGFELRGLTFVHEDENPKRYLMLNKFFNLNQVPTYQYHDVKDFKIVRVQDKCDGSMVRFLSIGGKLVAKTKMDFENDQCQMALDTLNRNISLVEFVKETLSRDEVAIFELVSPRNRIVLEYPKTELILLQIRCEKTGSYKNIYEHELVSKYNVKTSKNEEIWTLDEYVQNSESIENKEGWVLTLENGQMLKIKTKWYRELHGLLTENLVRENKIIEMILTETSDDALSNLKEDDIRRIYVTQIQDALTLFLNKKLKDIVELRLSYDGNRKEFAMKHHKNPLFFFVSKILDKDDYEDFIYKKLVEYYLDQNRRLMAAKDFVKQDLGLEVKDLESQFSDEEA